MGNYAMQTFDSLLRRFFPFFLGVLLFLAGAVAGVYLLQWQIEREVAAGTFICEAVK